MMKFLSLFYRMSLVFLLIVIVILLFKIEVHLSNIQLDLSKRVTEPINIKYANFYGIDKIKVKDDTKPKR
ncbi:MAG TPA: hypothetical protein VMV95_01615 [Bacillota bacterium]|nr:hypothetical protein [Bacillota bacterium]